MSPLSGARRSLRPETGNHLQADIHPRVVRFRQRPDLIVMDIGLDGDMDGIEAAREIGDRFGIRAAYFSQAGPTRRRVFELPRLIRWHS
jgi:CheY-like chemotaxis protein